MLRCLQSGTGRPISYPVDPNATFQPGMIAQIKVLGNDIVAGVSDGIAPFAIIDDVRDTAFVRPAIDEVVIIEAGAVEYDGYFYRASVESKQELDNPHIVASSFVSDVSGLKLNAINGVLVAPAGTKLNYTTPDSEFPNAIKAIVRYSYNVPNMPGEDTTGGSGRVTLWFTRGIFETDQYEMVPYAATANLYVSANGKLTTVNSIPNQPVVGMVIVPPTAHNSGLEFLWY